MDRVRMLEPVGYLEMLDLVENAFAVVTDSGGLQEETTALGIPCLTIRPNTERPITITEGTNRLVPDPADILEELRHVSRPAETPRPEGWDGHAGERVIAALVRHR
jgi:UDP-N-acetylglucosamine 2-epimerase (non-hydrolysing)